MLKVPDMWNMVCSLFINTVKRLRIMKGSEQVNLGEIPLQWLLLSMVFSLHSAVADACVLTCHGVWQLRMWWRPKFFLRLFAAPRNADAMKGQAAGGWWSDGVCHMKMIRIWHITVCLIPRRQAISTLQSIQQQCARCLIFRCLTLAGEEGQRGNLRHGFSVGPYFIICWVTGLLILRFRSSGRYNKVLGNNRWRMTFTCISSARVPCSSARSEFCCISCG